MGEWREEKGEQQSGWLVGGATALAARLLCWHGRAFVSFWGITPGTH